MGLATTRAGLVAFAVVACVVLDGFGLGVGILLPFAPGEAERDETRNSVAPVRDGNETSLVLGGGGPFAIFPLAFSIVLPALYAPILAMLLGLALRGVAFESRRRARRGQPIRRLAFAGGSLAAAVAQGVALGARLQGIEVERRAHAGGPWDWPTPFSLLTGAGAAIGYALLGATWLGPKAEGRTRGRARRAGRSPSMPWRRAPSATLCAPGLFALCVPGLGVRVRPDVLPGRVTIAEAAAPEASLRFLLAGRPCGSPRSWPARPPPTECPAAR